MALSVPSAQLVGPPLGPHLFLRQSSPAREASILRTPVSPIPAVLLLSPAAPTNLLDLSYNYVEPAAGTTAASPVSTITKADIGVLQSFT